MIRIAKKAEGTAEAKIIRQGGYPPESEGVCTDVIWRAFRDSGYDLKNLVDHDIRQNLSQVLTQEVKDGDVENLTQWQPGDIVTFGAPHEHVVIISDKRRPDGVPYIIHNAGPVPIQNDQLQSWPSPITGHFRFPRF